MATSSRQTNLFGVNDWQAIYKNYSQADFQSYDYDSLRKGFVDYLRTFYPETFNDYVESSEYVALLDVMAYMGQAMAFRNDLNARENFIDTAERRDSVLKLANLVGYNAKRNNSAQGYLKVTSISTTENIKDINGLNLSGLPVFWNDPANPDWQEQFNAVINAALISSQRIGKPGNSQTILGIKTDEYTVGIPTNLSPVLPFSATVNNMSMGFEAVSASSLNENYIYEIPPKSSGKFNILYRNDKLGFGSGNTGFFLYFKQGTLNTYDFSLDQQISNQLVDVDIEGINNEDTWLFNIESVTQEFIEWKKVDSVYESSSSQVNPIQRKVFSVKSRYNDQISFTFGDGVFSEIPIGNFRSYVRSGNALQYSINPSEMQGITLTLTYISKSNRVETLNIAVELTSSISNAQVRESLAEIKLRAPTKFYSQNRMVNGEDYNNFPYTLYSSIIKSKALNRSSVGVSRNLDLLDPTGKYSSTSSFADDGALYQLFVDDYLNLSVTTEGDVISFFTKTLVDILSNHRLRQYYVQSFPRYPVDSTTGDFVVKWNQTTFDDVSNITGYFSYSGYPIPVGNYNSGNMKYCTPGAMIKFSAPDGYYFKNEKLVSGLLSPSDKNYMWVNVLAVVEDGFNGGDGNLSNGLGPITLSKNVPQGAIVATIIPSFSTNLSLTLIQDAIARLYNNQSFTLNFNNAGFASLERWSIDEYSETDYLVNFKSLGNNTYLVKFKSLLYYFGSVKDTRFTFNADMIMFDPLNGKAMFDHVTLLKTNPLPNMNSSLSSDIILSVLGQPIAPDGYIDDFAVEVGNVNPNNRTLLEDPDFFEYVTGHKFKSTNTDRFVFRKRVVDANQLNTYELVPSKDVSCSYATNSQIEIVKYQYPIGQIFYAYTENTFFVSKLSAGTALIITLEKVDNYSAITGRQGLYFHYKHYSGDTTRIDPATTNIIDLYIATQEYYTQYQNWIKDTTGLIAEPKAPTSYELGVSYSKINDYKMLSDSVILNSVKFKPLFGSKAEPNLRAKLKVIKTASTNISDSEIKSKVLTVIQQYFSISTWNFGDTFYFSELSAYVHSEIGDLVSSVILVPTDPELSFGDLYEIRCAPYEIFVSAAQSNDIVVINALTADQLQIK